MNKDEVILVYDRQCPFCENYSQRLALKENIGQLTIIDARQPSKIVDEISQYGLNLDGGMVVIMTGTYYHGADAVHVLALLSSRSGMFNKFNYWCFRHKTISRILYPVLRIGRNIALKLMGKDKISNLN